MRKFFLQSACFALTIMCAHAQSRPLAKGDFIPDLNLTQFADRSEKNISFQQLRGKIIILDFWNVRCLACVHAFPRLDSLQKIFGSEIQILLVTKNDRKEINALMNRINRPLPDLPCIVEDSLLNRLFPHEGEPFQVWIGKDGKIEYLTSDYTASRVNIEAFLKGNRLSVSNLEFIKEFDYRKPLLTQNTTRVFDLVENYSLLIRGLHLNERNTVIRLDRDSSSKKVIRLTAINISILTLFNLAFNNDVFGYDLGTFSAKNNNRIIYEMSDSDMLFLPADLSRLDDWKKKNIVSYEIGIPFNAKYSIYNLMQDEVNRLFGIKGRIEKRKKTCLVLADSVDVSIKTKGGKAMIEYGNNYFRMQNEPLEILIRELQFRHYDLKTPIVSGLHAQQYVDLQINCNLSDLDAVQCELRRYGLKLVKEEKDITMLILSEKK